jgi:hypothetical protein
MEGFYISIGWNRLYNYPGMEKEFIDPILFN